MEEENHFKDTLLHSEYLERLQDKRCDEILQVEGQAQSVHEAEILEPQREAVWYLTLLDKFPERVIRHNEAIKIPLQLFNSFRGL